MYAKKNIDKKMDSKGLTVLGYLNLEKSVYLSESKAGDSKKRFLVKIIPLYSDSPQFQSTQQAILKKTFTSSICYFKPEFYDFQNNQLHIGYKVQSLSLQTLIWIHKEQQKLFSTMVLRDFTVRIFEGIARLKQSDIFPQNLKPSNIFLQIRSMEDKNWVWSEAGLHTTKRNQFYNKINLQTIAKNNSIKIDPFQMEFYSLAIILLEMITLQSPAVIDKVVRKGAKLLQIPNFQEAEEYYGTRLTNIIKLLLQPPKDNSLNKAIQDYKESKEQQQSEEPNYGQYQFSEERLQSFIKNQTIARMQQKAKDYIKDNNLCARDVFQKMNILDPEFNFSFTSIREVRQLFEYVGQKLDNAELIYVSTYFATMSSIKYFKFIQLLFPPKELIQCIIIKASENYDSFKEFFQSQTSGRDFWKAEQIKLFLESVQAPFEQKHIQQTLKEWTKSSSNKTTIKYAEIYGVFKPIIGMSMSLSTIKKPKGNQDSSDGGTLLRIMMHKLKRKLEQDKGQDLVTFFRKSDIKLNWTVDSKVYKLIKNYTKDKEFDEQKYKKAFLQMQKQGGVQGDMTNQIDYIKLIRNLQLEEPIDLLRQVFTQKINELGRQAFFQLYLKNEQGWTIQSFEQFNQDQGLEFEDRQLRILFSEMDSDKSGTIQTRQLFYRLTNIKQFDYSFIVDSVKAKIEKEGIYLFQYFQECDQRARLLLSSTAELKYILEMIGLELSQDHLHQFFNKFSKKGRFDYMTFLRQFHPKPKLFFSAVQFIISVHYKGDFDRLYQMGLKQGKKKWNLQSLQLINEQMALDFRRSQLEQIWQFFDPNNEGSLTKQEVSQKFGYEFVKTTQLTTKNVQSIKDLQQKRKQEKQKKQSPAKKVNTDRNKQPKGQSLLQQLKRLGEKQLNALCLKMIDSTPDMNGSIYLADCLQLMQNSGVASNKKEIAALLNNFTVEWTKKPSVNIVKLFYYIYDQIFQEDEENLAKIKAHITILIIKEIKKLKGISNADLFLWCKRKDKMRLSDFEQVFRNIVEVEVFFEDLEGIWKSWGDQDFYTQETLDQLLQTKQYKPKQKQKQKMGKEKEIPKLQKKQSNKAKLKLSEENKMIDFINQEERDTPQLRKPMSFGQKDPTFRRQNSNRNSIRQSGNVQADTPINRFKAQSTQRGKQPEIKGLEKKKSSFGNKKQKQQKVQLEQFVNPIKQDKKKQTNKVTYTKNQLLQKLREQIVDNGDQYINELFSKTNIIQSKRLIGCLTIHYDFSQEEALQLVQYLAKFDKIKLDTIKTHLSKKNESPQKEEDKKGKSKQKFERNRPTMQDKNTFPSPKQKQGKRVIDPRRQKINIPLVKQNIKHLKAQFCKRFQLNQLQPYFFADKQTVCRQDFITKCQSISTTFSSNICEKIFDYLKPDTHDKVNGLSFKLGMGVDEPVQQQQQDYLPQDLQKQLKVVFQKADKDHSGFIQPNQIQELLSSLGFNQNIKQIQNYFAKMDQNFDNRISYNEFRRFIEDQILPQISNFDEDEQQLQQTLRNNDIFRTGALAATTFQAVIERYGVKLTPLEVQVLIRTLNPQGSQIRIVQLLNAVRQPANFSGKVKGALYKIRLRKKVQLRQVQKVFENISSCFVLAYTPAAMQKELLNISSPYRPILHESGLFYCDLSLRDARKIGQSEQGLVGGEIANSDILVQMVLKEVSGVPIPQKTEIKSNIVRRYMNLSFFDLSAEIMKYSVWQVQAQFDSQVQDVWRFSNAVRSLFIKVGGYEARKFQKIVLLFELVIVVVEGNRTLEINCGCCTLPLRQLIIPEGKIAKKLKLIAGLPNRSKQIDKNSISKRSGWKNFFGGDVQSELQIELVHQNKFKQYHRMLAGLPPQVILARKALHYLWVYRQSMAQSAFDGNNVNPFLSSDLRILAFRLSLDVPQVFGKVCIWWKQKVESRIKTLSQAKKVFKVLMQQLYLILHAKQFELVKRCPTKPFLHNKSLTATRSKMINDALQNVDAWISTGTSSGYKRKKGYNYNYGPLQLHQIDVPKEHHLFMQNIAKLIVK